MCQEGFGRKIDFLLESADDIVRINFTKGDTMTEIEDF